MGGLFGRPASPQTNATAIGSLSVQTSAYGTPIPWVFGTARVSPNLLQYADFKAIPHTSSQSAGGKGGGRDVTTTNYTYTAAVILGLTHGPVAGITKAWKDKELASVASLQLDVYNGSSAQAPHPYFATKHADQALAYRGVSYVASGAYDLGSSATLGNHSFEVQTNTTIPGKPDAKISDVIRSILTDAEQGLGLSAASLGDWTQFDNFCLANGIWVSPVYKEQKPAYEAIKRLLQIGFADCVRSNGVLKIIPYSDAAAVSPLAEYVPTIAPCADLTEDDFLTSDSPVRITRKSQSETFNHVKVKYSDRTNDYNDSVAEAKDQADIEAFGLRSMSDVELKEICDPAVAQKVADFILQRSLSIRNEYEFQLAWKYCWLEPMDVVRLWYPRKGLSGQPVLITEVAEDEDGTLTVKAEDYPLGANRATLVPPTTTSGYTPDFSVDPGNATVPAILEAPLALTNGEPQLWLATAGGANWGGADVWISTDNISYQKVGRHATKSRYGTLTAPLPAGAALDSLNTVAVDLTASGGVLQGGTQQNAQDLLTRSLIGGEFFAFANANLVSLGKYNLSYLVRGAYGSDIVDHAAGETFVRLDDGLFAYAYPKEWMGKAIWVKLVSVNVYGGGAQDLSSVPAYMYTIQGAPVGAVQNLRITSAWTAGTDVKVAWDLVPDAASYDVEIWAGAVPQRVRSLNVKGNEFAYDPQDQRADGGPWRSVTVKVRSRALTGRVGRWVSVSALNPQIGALLSVTVDAGIRTGYVKVKAPDDSDFEGIVVWCSTDPACAPVDANKVYDGVGTVATINKLGTGAALVGGTQYYVRAAAYDSFGKDGLSVSTAVSFTAGGVIPDAGTVGASQLVADLNAKVNLIDAPVGVAGSVAQRIADEAAARTGADSANAASISAEITARQSGDSANAAQIIAEITARQAGDSKNASDIAAEISARAGADTVLNSRVDTLSASFSAAGNENMYIGPETLQVLPGAYGSQIVVIKDALNNPYGLQAGEVLTLSADLWLDAASVVAGEYAQMYLWAADASSVWSTSAVLVGSTSSVARKSASVVLPSDAGMAVVAVGVYHFTKTGGATGQVGNAYAGRIQVERGAVATGYKAGQQRLNAAISTESTVRASADAALSLRVDSVKSQADGNAAAITSESGTRAGADSALSSRIDTVKAQADGNAAAITTETNARVGADSALGSRIDALTSAVGGNSASITTEQTVRANADVALGARIDTLKASVDGNTASISSESAARVSGDAALGGRIDSLTTTVSGNAASITSEAAARSSADSALGVRIDSVTATASANAAAITVEQTARANADAANAAQIATVAANFGAAGGENMYIGPEPLQVFPAVYGSQVVALKDTQNDAYGLKAGEVLTVSADVWLDAASVAAGEYAQMYLWAADAGGTWTTIAVIVVSTSSVVRKSASVVLPAEPGMAVVAVGIYHFTKTGGSSGQVGSAYAGRIQVERGGVATGYKAGQQRLNAAISSEATVRASVDAALSLRVDSVKSLADGNTAAIISEAGTRASADGALSSRIDTVKAQADGNAAAITTETNARVGADSALGSRIDALTSTVGGNTASITNEQTARANADAALGARIDTLKASVDGNTASISSESAARVSGDAALGARIDSLTTTVSGNTASITSEAAARSSADSALGVRIDAVTATASANAAAITAEQTARANADAANATQIATVAANFGAAGGENMYIGPEPLPIAPGVYGSAAVIIKDAVNNPFGLTPGETLTLSADLWVDAASAAAGEYCRLYLWAQDANGTWTGASALTCSSGVVARYAASLVLPSTAAAITSVAVALYHLNAASTAAGSAGYAYAGRVQVERGGVATAYKGSQQRLNAAVQTEAIARAAADSALSSQVSTVQTTVNGHTASIQQQATSINGLQAQFTVKTDVNGYVSGFGLATDASTGTPVSDFTVLADRFAVVKPGMQKRVPFVVTTVNGQSTVGIDGNLLVNGSIVGAALAANTITGDRVAAQTIQTGNLAAGAVTTQILAAGAVQAGNIQAGAVTADKLNVTTLSAVSGQIGLLRTAASGGRTEIADNVIKVFDEYGVLRVKIGNLAL